MASFVYKDKIESDLVVRLASPSDGVKTIWRVVNDAYRIGEEGIFVDTAEHPFQRASLQDVEEFIAQKQILILIDEGSGAIKGCIKVAVEQSEEEQQQISAEWGCLAVALAEQGKGYGRTLVMAAEEYARKVLKCTVLELQLLTPIEWKHTHKERLREWYTKRLGYELIYPGDLEKSTFKLVKGTLLGSMQLAIDACFTIYRKAL